MRQIHIKIFRSIGVTPFHKQIFGSGGMIPFSNKPFHKNGLFIDRKAQSAVWGLLSILVLVIITGGLVDIYRLYAARNWAYSVAQEAALAGASRGREWNTMLTSGTVRLDEDVASEAAQEIVQSAMHMRGITGYQVSIHVLPDPSGGTIAGFPPRPVRLGEDLSDWSSDEPAVGVYLEVPVQWTILNSFGINQKEVRVFAAAGVAQ
ncbi:MAG: Tad domain-containing protein [Anaerolineaceae bacterium]|nr:Tad domain-containing protein [Anaerolineaceae bacterium]